jgi:hypothetical protein
VNEFCDYGTYNEVGDETFYCCLDKEHELPHVGFTHYLGELVSWQLADILAAKVATRLKWFKK